MRACQPLWASLGENAAPASRRGYLEHSSAATSRLNLPRTLGTACTVSLCAAPIAGAGRLSR